MATRSPLVYIVPMLLLLAACFSSPDPATDATTDTSARDSGGDDTGPSVGPTWLGDLAPVVAAHCLECHQSGGAAPFALDTLETMRAYAKLIVETTAARTMPPYVVDNSGDCQTYHDARWLTDDEIALFAAWVDAGMPEGTGADPVPPEDTSGLREEDVVVDIGGDYTPDWTIVDDYRCYVIDLPVSGQQYIAGYHTVPGNVPLAHHITLYMAQDQATADAARAMDEAEDGPGYSCPRSLGVPNYGVIALWNVGTPAINFPEGTGIPIDATYPMLVREHYYVPQPDMGSDRTSFHFDFEESVETPAHYAAYSNEDIELPPGEASISSTADFTPRERGDDNPMTFWGAAPHMHQLATGMEVWRNPDTDDAECLVRSTTWDYHWQGTFFYDTPMAVDPDDVIRVSCTWDTTSQTDTVVFGAEAADEMCLVAFYATE